MNFLCPSSFLGGKRVRRGGGGDAARSALRSTYPYALHSLDVRQSISKAIAILQLVQN